MNTARPRKPSPPGTPSNFYIFCGAVWELLFNGKFPFQDSDTIKWNRGPDGYSARATPPSAPGGAKGIGLLFCGEWDPVRTYSAGNMVVITAGSNQGTYVYINDSPTSGNAPYAGGGFWVQLPIGPAAGLWL
jgi:hypothetical protein